MTYTMQSTRKIFDGINTYIEESHKNSTQIQNNTTQEVQRLAQQMHTTFDQTQKQLSDSLGIIENKLQHTLNQSLMTLGQQLGSLSTKFANDYEPITVNLKKIIDSLDGELIDAPFYENHSNNGSDHWISLSDIMTALMMVLLISIIYMIRVKESVDIPRIFKADEQQLYSQLKDKLTVKLNKWGQL